MRGSEHLLLNTEIWGLSTEHATTALEVIKCAAQNQHIPIHSHDISSQCFTVSVIAIGVNIINIICLLKLRPDYSL